MSEKIDTTANLKSDEAVLSAKNLNQKIAARIEARQDEINALINTKIDRAIDHAINAAFRDTNYETGYATKLVQTLVKKNVKEEMQSITVDRAELRSTIQKKLTTQLNKIKVNVNASIG
jgi:hypothetical protein